MNGLYNGYKMEYMTRVRPITPMTNQKLLKRKKLSLNHIAKQSWDSSDELMKQIMQNIPMSKWKPFQRDVNKLLKQHSIREEVLSEKKWDISQKTQGGTNFRNSMAFHSRELQKLVSLYKNKHKVDKEEMKYYMNIWMKGFHKRLKDLGVL